MKSDFELKDLEFKVVDKVVARDFTKKYHYTRKASQSILNFGAYYNGELKNLIVYRYPTGRLMAQQVMEGGSNENTLELIRMVSLEPKPKNMESYCIHHSFKHLKENMPNIKIIISYADNSVGHHGYCYQASGFTYYGQSRPTKEWYLDGARYHEKNFNMQYGSSSVKKMKEMFGDRLVVKSNKGTKSRYYYILAQDKREKKEILKNIKVESKSFPKGDNSRYNLFQDEGFAYLGKKEYRTTIFDYDVSNSKEVYK